MSGTHIDSCEFCCGYVAGFNLESLILLVDDFGTRILLLDVGPNVIDNDDLRPK